MYYLDFTKLHKMTTKEQRTEVRRSLSRNEVMAKKLKQQHNTCFYCTSAITMADHLDHLIPVYYGGDNKLRNLVAACRDCNMTKSKDMLEITNPYTIKDYQKLIEAHKKDQLLPPRHRRKRKRAQLYYVYKAYLFRSI